MRAGDMRPSECGFHNPPAEGTRDREVVDRFSDFLRLVGKPATQADIDAGRVLRLSAAARYHLKFMAWRMGEEAIDLSEQLARVGV